MGIPGITPSGSPPFTPRAKKVLELSLREALQLGHSYIGTEHLLLGLVREGEGVACQVLIGLGADPGRVRQKVLELMGEHPGPVAMAGERIELRSKGVVTAKVGGASPRFTRPVVPRTDRCSVCERDLWEVARYVVAGRVQICDECARSAARAVERAKPEARMLPMPPRVFGDPPDEAAAENVVGAVDAAFGSGASPEDRAGAVEDFASLEPAFRQVADLYAVPASIRVSRVRFTGPDVAEIRFHLAILGTEPSFHGQVRRHEGRWTLTRQTAAEVLRWAGADVPPPRSPGEPEEPR